MSNVKITAAQLNAVAKMIGTTDKTVVIETTIAILIDAGMDAKAAYDAVIGEGAFSRLASELYDEFQKQAA